MKMLTNVVTLSVSLFVAGSLWAGTITPPFAQCPAIGADTSCGILYVFNPGGTVTSFVDASQGPYDSTEDTLVGVLNSSGVSVPSLTLSGVGVNGIPIFAFDGDGICTFPGGPACGTTGYEGPKTSFTGISADKKTGTIVFAGGLANGASAYFSLEDKLTVAPPVAGAAPEPATLSLLGLGMAAVALKLRKRSRA